MHYSFQSEGLVGITDILRLVGRRKTWLYRLVDEGKFPRPYKVGVRSCWDISDARKLIERIKAGEFASTDYTEASVKASRAVSQRRDITARKSAA
jgi:predicted DNA-binding transcriptional regulator AlpA